MQKECVNKSMAAKTSFAALQIVHLPVELMTAICDIESRVKYVPNCKGGYYTGGQAAQLSYEDCEFLNTLLVGSFPQVMRDDYRFDHFMFLKYDTSCKLRDYHWDTDMCQIGNLSSTSMKTLTAASCIFHTGANCFHHEHLKRLRG